MQLSKTVIVEFFPWLRVRFEENNRGEVGSHVDVPNVGLSAEALTCHADCLDSSKPSASHSLARRSFKPVSPNSLVPNHSLAGALVGLSRRSIWSAGFITTRKHPHSEQPGAVSFAKPFSCPPLAHPLPLSRSVLSRATIRLRDPQLTCRADRLDSHPPKDPITKR